MSHIYLWQKVLYANMMDLYFFIPSVYSQVVANIYLGTHALQARDALMIFK